MRLFIWRLMDNKRYFLRRIRIWFRNITLFSSNNAQTIFVICILYMAIPEIKGSVFMMVRSCVRDWSGILCEKSDSGASKDIAESPTAERSGAGTPRIETQNFRISELQNLRRF